MPKPPAILALAVVDTECSVAYCPADGQVVQLRQARVRSGGEVLAPLLRQLLHNNAIDPKTIAGIAAHCGPGSFTGMRVTLAAALALGQAWGVPVVGVPYHAAVALALPQAVRLGKTILVATPSSKDDWHVAALDAAGKILYPPTAQPQPHCPENLMAKNLLWLGPGAALGQSHSGGEVYGEKLPEVDAAAIGAYAQVFWQMRDTLVPEALYLRGAAVTVAA